MPIDPGAPLRLAAGAARVGLRVPRAVSDAAEAAGEAVRRLPGLEQLAADRIASLDQGLRDLLSLLPEMASDLRRVRQTVEPQESRVHSIEDAIGRLEGRIDGLQASLDTVARDVHGALELLPGPDSDTGPVAAVRDALTGRA